MREGRASVTAAIVASARGATGIDPFAARLVPRGFRRLARAKSPTVAHLLPLTDHMRVRTLAIDEAVADAVERGTTQVVILGAGLCARAWRMPRLTGSIVYEVDHPSTQRYKRERLAGVAPEAREVRFVGVDFERDDLSSRLDEAGHDARSPTTWIWEGVTPYLTPEAISVTIASVGARSAPGSTFIVTYGTPVANRAEELPRRVLYRVGFPLFRVIGEPIRGLLDVRRMHELLERAGFVVEVDSTYRELARRLGVRAPKPFITERIVVATVPARRTRSGNGAA